MSTAIGIIRGTQQVATGTVPILGRWVGVDDVADTGRGGVNRQIAAELRAQIAALPPGARLPSEEELAKRHNVSRPTVRRALDLLILEGLILREAQAGHFVRGYAPELAAGLPVGAPEFGAVINVERVAAPDRVAEFVPGESFLLRRRAHSQATVYDSHYPKAVVSAVPELSDPVPLGEPDEVLFARAGMEVAERLVDVYARSAGEEQCLLLGVPAGTALLEQVTALRDAKGAVLVVRVAWLDGHRRFVRFRFDQ